MTAYTSVAAIGVAKKTESTLITVVFWRANRLVDTFAKSATAEHEVGDKCVRCFANTERVSMYALTQLASVTRAANARQSRARRQAAARSSKP